MNGDEMAGDFGLVIRVSIWMGFACTSFWLWDYFGLNRDTPKVFYLYYWIGLFVAFLIVVAVHSLVTIAMFTTRVSVELKRQNLISQKNLEQNYVHYVNVKNYHESQYPQYPQQYLQQPPQQPPQYLQQPPQQPPMT